MDLQINYAVIPKLLLDVSEMICSVLRPMTEDAHLIIFFVCAWQRVESILCLTMSSDDRTKIVDERDVRHRDGPDYSVAIFRKSNSYVGCSDN
jgi:hypothetical protein